MRTFTFFGLLMAGVAAGFGAVAGLLSLEQREKPALDVTASMQADKGWIGTAVEGWGATSRRGTVLAEASATLEVPLPAQLAEPIVVDILARPEPLNTISTLSASINGKALGGWQLNLPRSKRLLFQAEAVKGKQTITITVATDKPGAAIIQEIRLRDLKRLGDFKGHLDECRGSVAAGWASAGDDPAPIMVYRGGELASIFVPDVLRGDLKKFTLAADAGFRVALSPPIKPGEPVELRFPNGRRLKGVACKA